jgi:hypothetical protein
MNETTRIKVGDTTAAVSDLACAIDKPVTVTFVTTMSRRRNIATGIVVKE